MEENDETNKRVVKKKTTCNSESSSSSEDSDESLLGEETTSERIWSDALTLILHVLLPIAITGLIIGRKAIFARIVCQLDKSCISIFCPSFSKQEKLKKWMHNYLPYIEGGLTAIWKDGSVMCTLINSVVPGACPNPHRHWKKPPTHGQALAYKYLGVVPVFSEADFKNSKPTSTQEKLLLDYVTNLQTAIEKLTPNQDLTFSTRYIARGMGLMTGEQHRKTIIYIYSNFKSHKSQQEDLLIHVRGPYNTYGTAVLKARDFSRNSNSNFNENKRQKSFLNSISADFSNLLKPKEKGPACDIQIRIDFEKDRAKLIFVPNNSGVYEICMTTNGEHIAGSPYNLNIEKNQTGMLESLYEEESKLVDVKNIKKKVANTVIFYEKLKKTQKEEKELPNGNEENLEDKCHIVGLDSTEKNKKSDGQVSDSILNTVEQLNTLLENSEHIKQVSKPEKLENFGLNIIDTLRHIPQLKESYEIDTSIELNNEVNEIKSEGHIKIKPDTNSEKNIDSQRDEHPEQDKILTPVTGFIENSRIKNEAGSEETVNQNSLILTTFTDMKSDYNFPNEQNTIYNSISNIIQNKAEEQIQEIKDQTDYQCLEDSGTYLNDDIDPDSLASSSIEMEPLQGSSEEISIGTGSDDHEVNNNNIIIKSNEDICYLILNQSENCRKRVYSKDFISCKDDKSKDDLSKSDSNLNIMNSLNSVAASGLSHDNVQEASTTRSRANSSRVLKQHTQEDKKQGIAGTRIHSYSHGSLLETSSNRNNEQDNAEENGLEFKQHFLRRKAFWTNMSMSNVNLSEKWSGRTLNTVKNCKSVEKENGLLNEGINQKNVQSEKIDGNFNTESYKSVNNIELRSRSLDYVRQRRKTLAYENVTTEGAKYGSVDDLNFPSVQQRKELYLKEQHNLFRADALDKDKDLYAVRGDKCSWSSIHEKIKCFENSSNTSPITSEPLTTLQENITITTKIKERFESAQTYFKGLENKVNEDNNDTKRYSLDAELAPSLSSKKTDGFLSLRINDMKNNFDADKKPWNKINSTNRHSVPLVCNNIDNQNLRKSIDDKELQLQWFLNEKKKKMKHSTTTKNE